MTPYGAKPDATNYGDRLEAIFFMAEVDEIPSSVELELMCLRSAPVLD